MKSNILRTQCSLLAIVLLMNSALVVLEARPMSIIATGSSATEGEVVDFFDWFSHSLGSMKPSGPSPGEGHKFSNTETLGGIKDSGPSGPGVGHKFTNADTLGGIKDSGPSGPGVGHKFTNADTLGGIKESGPSSGGNGHKFTDSEILGEKKNSGPSPGQGH